jgi:hypothetical protein
MENNSLSIDISFGKFISRIMTIKKKKNIYDIDFQIDIFDKCKSSSINNYYIQRFDFDVIRNLCIKKLNYSVDELQELVRKYVIYVLEVTTKEKLLEYSEKYYILEDDIKLNGNIRCNININDIYYVVDNEEVIHVLCELFETKFTYVSSKYKLT